MFRHFFAFLAPPGYLNRAGFTRRVELLVCGEELEGVDLEERRVEEQLDGGGTLLKAVDYIFNKSITDSLIEFWITYRARR